MLKLNISTRPIRLEYTIQNARLNLQSTRPKVQIERTPATLEIHQPQGELIIDQTSYRYSIGFKNITDFSRDFAALGRQTAIDFIAQIVEEGNQMAQIENKSNAIAEIAAASSLSEVPEITWAPIAPPEIHYQANPVEINPAAGKLNFTVQSGAIQGDYLPGSLDIRVIQYPGVEISTVDVKV